MSDLNEVERGQLCQSTIESLYEATGGLKHFPGLLKKIIANRAWERRINKGKVIELSSLRELITENPVRGWGEDPEKVKVVISHDPEALLMFREAMKCQEGGDKRSQDATTSNNITGDGSVTGTSRAYSIDRVQRACDEATVVEVMSGRMSPNAALIIAGVRKRQVSIPVDDIETAVRRLKKNGFTIEKIVEAWSRG